MKLLSLNEINNLKFAKQHFQDCYLVSSIGALSKSMYGRRTLFENIVHTDKGYRIRFNNIDGRKEDFFATHEEMDKLIYMDKYMNPIPIAVPHNPVIKALEVAMNKLLEKHPSKKPFICRFPSCNEKFEFNKPSNFLEMFTGKKPIKLNEGGIRLNLKSKKENAEKIFEEIKRNPNCSFVAGTSIGLNKGLSDNHCYTVDRVNKNNTIELFDHRFLETITLTYEQAINKLKFLVGYFNQELK